MGQKFPLFRNSLCLAAVVCLFAVQVGFAQSGSYLESIYKAEDGKSQESLSAPTEESSPSLHEEAAPVSAPVPGNLPETVYQKQCMNEEQIQAIIQQIIQQIMGACGSGGCAGRRVIIIIRKPGSGCGTTTTPTSTPTTPPTTTTPTTPTTTPGTGSDAGTVAGLAAEMQSTYGISPKSGQGGTSWTLRQLQEAMKVLKSLPAAFRSCTKSIARDSGSNMPGVLGYVQMGIPMVHLLSACCSMGSFQGTLVHEMTHTFQASHPEVYRAFYNQFWPGGRQASSSVSRYGNTQPVEDMAEAVRAYYQSGPSMKSSNPARYEFVKNNVFGGTEFQPAADGGASAAVGGN